MSDEVAVREEQAPAPAPAAPGWDRPASSDLEQWGRDAQLVYATATNLVKTSFVPRSYQGNPFEATAAILTGQEIGLKPMAALRSINVIQGMPAMAAVALRALAQSKGHEIWLAEASNTRAIVRGRRRGSDRVQESAWTMDRARSLGLHTKDNWKTQPMAMLVARATSELVRLIAADVILGVPYSVEELEDQGLIDNPDDVVETPKPTTKVRRKGPSPRAKAVEPDLPGDAPAEEKPVEEPTEKPAEEAPAEEAVESRDESAVADDARRAFENESLQVEEPELSWDDIVEPEKPAKGAKS